MPKTHDVIVLGCGAMGSATLAHLARRGLNVLGLDTFHPPHTQGSSHGQTRIIREAYFEHPSYVPLVQRAYQLWKELEDGAPEPLFLQTGGLMIGETGGVVFEGRDAAPNCTPCPARFSQPRRLNGNIPPFACRNISKLSGSRALAFSIRKSAWRRISRPPRRPGQSCGLGSGPFPGKLLEAQ